MDSRVLDSVLDYRIRADLSFLIRRFAERAFGVNAISRKTASNRGPCVGGPKSGGFEIV